jgi:hypothetical protein
MKTTRTSRTRTWMASPALRRPHPLLLLCPLLLLLPSGCEQASGAEIGSFDAAAGGVDVALGGDGAGGPDVPGGVASGEGGASTKALPYAIVDTGQSACWDMLGYSGCADDLLGQDAQWHGVQPSYQDEGDGTVRDRVTGLTWQHEPVLSTFAAAPGLCGALELGGHGDWRVPSTKELYSLIDFDGRTGSGGSLYQVPADAVPYLDTEVFGFAYGTEVDMGAGGRYIDSQFVTSTAYVHTVMNGQAAFFGVNFADGRIKGYPQDGHGRSWFLRCVRGEAYGGNDFEDAGDGTIHDRATGLTWIQADSAGLGAGSASDGTMDWGEALAWCEALEMSGAGDWRLPNAKELHSLVDYSRSPDTTGSAALDPIFEATPITNELGQQDFGFYWTSTTHLDGRVAGTAAVYVAFGRAMGQMQGVTLDVHGAGAQRGDPKTGARSDYPMLGMGPQGDVRRVFNLARCVRGGADFGEATGEGGARTRAPEARRPERRDPRRGPEGRRPPAGPLASCVTQADCELEGACPADAIKGCRCAPPPGPPAGRRPGQGVCVPACAVHADCPSPPDVTLICGWNGLCVPGPDR